MSFSNFLYLDILGEEAKMESARNTGLDAKPKSIEDLKTIIAEYLPADKVAWIEEAYEFAAEAHALQKRKSGEPFVEHPLQIAIMLASLQLDAPTIVAALLHDVPEDCDVPLSDIEKKFTREVRTLVEGVTKLSRIAWHGVEETGKRHGAEDAELQAENLRKMLISMAEDIRVVMIKLADRLHNMRTLAALSPAKRKSIAQETMEIYAPLASRLGIWEFKWELEDLSFRYLNPEKYKEIAHLVASRRVSRERYISQVVELLKKELAVAGIEAEISGRPKHIYSIHRKMEKYALHGKDFGQIYDLLAVRVLVDSVQDCYTSLGVIHNLWHPVPGQFDDYIANPKESMYQSLHTTVMCLGARPLEIQVRSHEMHQIAEYGIAAHWRYKEGAASKKDVRFDDKMAWLRQLVEWQRDLAGAEEFVESVKTDIFRDQVFVYTPKGEIKDLPAGSTPLDFAYRIHTDLGHRCVGAKVNSRLVSLDSQLKNGDVVEILTSKNARGPSRDWLNPNLGFIRTSRAKEKIRQWFKRLEREDNVDRGKELLDKELKRIGLSVAVEEIARLFKYDKSEDLLLAIGIGELNTHQIAVKLAGQDEEEPEVTLHAPQPVTLSSAIEVMGVGDLLSHLAQCCSPVPGDEIIGYITRTSGVTVHRRDCHNIRNHPERERLVRVDWGKVGKQMYPVPVRIEAWDRVGLLRDISTVVSEEKVNMSAVQTVTQTDRTATITLTLETSGISQLSRVLTRIEGIKGVLNVLRDLGHAKG